MFSLHLNCTLDQVEELSFRLWEAGTVGIREEDHGAHVELIAGFENIVSGLLEPDAVWRREDDTDWVAFTQQAWPARVVGKRLFLAARWNKEVTPEGRCRVVHNPGLASGTGEHPCTQLALLALENCIKAGEVVIDIGTGSGMLSLAALALGAQSAFGFDVDEAALPSGAETFRLNGYAPTLVNGSADCIIPESADIVVANISGTVLLSMADELLGLARPGGVLIVTGFPESELTVIERTFGAGELTAIEEWRCLALAV